MYEAWQEGAAVACSNVTSLPEQAGDAALIFDPYSIDTIAKAIQELWLNEVLRNNLQRLGQKRLRDFSWEKTSKAYRALYRWVAGRELTSDEIDLLAIDWMSGKQNMHFALFNQTQMIG